MQARIKHILEVELPPLEAFADSATGTTTEQGEQLDTLLAEVQNLQTNVSRTMTLAEVRSFVGPTARILPRETGTQATEPDTDTSTGSDGEGENFSVGQDRAATRPFSTFSEFMTSVHGAAMPNQQPDVRLFATGASEGVPSDGGFLVQQDFASEIIQVMHETGQIAGRCRNLPISSVSNSIVIHGVDETSRATGSRLGGVRGYWANEAATKTASKPQFRRMTLTLNKLIVLVYGTDELLADTTAFETITVQGAGEEIAFMLDDAIYEGDGSGKPIGILDAPATIEVAKETAQPAATIKQENIDEMYTRMAPRSIPKAVWFINQDCWPQLFALERVVGTGGIPVFIRPNGSADAPWGTLMGRPIVVIEQASTLGTAGDIMFADMSWYIFADKGAPKSDVSIHVQFVTDETAFRFVYRVDGQPTLSSALTPFKGSNTTSPFVKLATRA